MKKFRSFLVIPSVTNANKPGKVRRVANASSVFQGQSLNSNLLKGPDLLSNLTGVILRFRENKIALSADIEKLFIQVKVAPEDRKFLRFLWKNDGRIETYDYTSHIFGATDSPCIASYALQKTARDNEESSQICRTQHLHRWSLYFHKFTRRCSKNTARNEKCSL